MKATRLLIWRLVSSFERYETIRPGIKQVTHPTTPKNGVILNITDFSNRQWEEQIVSWKEHYGYTLAVKIKDYPYPLNKHHIILEITDSEQGSMLTVTVDYSVKYGPFGRLLDTISIKHALGKLTGQMIDNIERLVSAETLKNL